jgi:hypothetical protein
MSGVVTLQRAITPRNFTAAVDPTSGDDAADGVRVGDYWFNTATGNVFQCVTSTTGAAVWRHVPRVLGQGGAAAALTGTTSETTLASVTVKGGAMGVQGQIMVHSSWSYTNSANNKNARLRIGGLAGTVCMNYTVTTTATLVDLRRVANRNSASSQTVTASSGGHTGGFGTSANALPAPVQNTANDFDLVLTGQLASAGETITLESWTMTLFRPDIT